jgi:hypothetical protein
MELRMTENDLRDDGVDIDLPSHEEIEGALKYLKNNMAAGVDTISAGLLKNCGPNLVKFGWIYFCFFASWLLE